MKRFLSLACAALLLCQPTVAADQRPFPTTYHWGLLVANDELVELRVDKLPADRVIRFQRFNNAYRKIFLKSDDSKQALKFQPGLAEWLITLPESTTVPAVVVIETNGAPELLTQPFVCGADKDGAIVLPAHHAIVHGKNLRYEPQPQKNTLGYWANEDDWCEWQINVTESGTYQLEITQGCGKGHGGSVVQIEVNGRRLTYAVQDTGHFNTFEKFDAGRLRLEKGRHTLQVKPQSKAKAAVMDLRQIRLVPVREP